jgi:murein DD-endopeptidase MepM/ murein hydrolase activator NlpD
MIQQGRMTEARTGHRWIGPLIVVALVGAVLLAGLLVSRGVQGKPRLSGYKAGSGNNARLVTLPAKGGAAAAVAPAAPAAPAAAAGQVLANPNNKAIPATQPADKPFGLPVVRTDWVISKDYAGHGGHSNTGAVDVAIWHDYQAAGSVLVATHAGKVKLLQDDPTYGNLVYVIGAHYSTTYGHMQKFAVKDGDQVVRGSVLGEMGSTGNSTGPHVDYQVWLDGDNRNPMDYGIPGLQGAGPMHP